MRPRSSNGPERRRPKPQAARSNRAVDSTYGKLSTNGELAERQGTAVLTRRDLRVGQVRLLHSPPIGCQLFPNDHHDGSGRRVLQPSDFGNIEAEDGGTLDRHRLEEPLFKSKFVRELAPHHLGLAELPGALPTVDLQIHWFARRFLMRKADDVPHLVRSAGIIDPARQYAGL